MNSQDDTPTRPTRSGPVPDSPASSPSADEAAALGGRVGFGVSPALVLVDAVRAYVESGSPLHVDGAGAVAGMKRLLHAARTGGRPVCYTRVVLPDAVAEAGYFSRKVPALEVLRGDVPLGRVLDDLAPGGDEPVMNKEYASAFFGTTLASWLTSRHVDTVVLAGFSTSGCVRSTAVDALQLGFRPIVAGDGCADRDETIHRANLSDLDAKYADVVPVDEAAQRLATRADRSA